MDMQEILTIQEVAEYLRVSERTVYDWATKGTIPCGKLGTSWRFKRSEIEKWVNDRLQPNMSVTAPSHVSIPEFLSPDRIVLFSPSSKQEALEALIDVSGKSAKITNKSEIMHAIFEREKLMSTGIGHGIGVPHVRLESVNSLVMSVGISSKDITDYESLDGAPVRIIVMILSNKSHHALYLKTLAEISRRIKSELFRKELLNSKNQSEAYAILTR
ncbi:PTS sugar transporter subunit IIA [bacterium]|nr:PTS sugar transporter subunit IIA [bacterium]